MESRGLRIALRIWVVLVLLFLFVPIALIFLYAFDKSTVQSWPISGFTVRWFSVAWHDPDVRQAFLLSIKVGLLATLIALVLGSMVAYAVHKFAFFGREAVSFLLVLPLALPGIVTGIALSSFFSFTGTGLSILTIVIGHATFCIVVVYNNVVARLRRVPGSLSEASADLGARSWQTMRLITLPMAGTALISGALLAFALSFDEVIVTVFTAGAQNTLPLWIFGAIRLGQQLPEVNAVVSVVILLTLIPVILAARVAGAGAISRTARTAEVAELAVQGQFGAGGDVELAEGVAQVGLDRGLGDEQVLGDLPVGQALGRQDGDPTLASGQRVRAGQGGPPGPRSGREQLPLHLGGQPGGAGALGEVERAEQRLPGLRPLAGAAQAGAVVGQGQRQLVAGRPRLEHADRLGQVPVHAQRDAERQRAAGLA